MGFTGVNTKCAQCTKKCKQFKNVTVVYCPNFVSVASNKQSPGNLQAGDNRLDRD